MPSSWERSAKRLGCCAGAGNGLAACFAGAGRRKYSQGGRFLVRRLAGLGLLEYRAGYSLKSGRTCSSSSAGCRYWPQTAELNGAIGSSSHASRICTARDCDVLESPCASALFQIHDPKAASFVAMLSAPQQIGKLRKQEGFPGMEFLGLLVDCKMAFKTQEGARSGLRWAEGDNDLVLWDFHDLLFHTRSTEGGMPTRWAELIRMAA